jgi:hypothetical protein
MPMKYIIDTHLHIYPFYSIHNAIDSLINNLHSADPESTKVGCLTERYDCDVFNQLADAPSADVTDAFSIINTGNCLHITHKETAKNVYILPGQQIITSENLEVLSLNCPQRVKEGNSALQTIESVLAQGGIPVIAFGFGKWLGKRGAIVEKLIEGFGPEQIAMGDTTMRPYGWTTPKVFRKAENKGIKILCGSDPLPFKGEESRPGSYGTRLDLNGDDPVQAISGILGKNTIQDTIGKRNNLFEVAMRMQNHRKAGKIDAR